MRRLACSMAIVSRIRKTGAWHFLCPHQPRTDERGRVNETYAWVRVIATSNNPVMAGIMWKKRRHPAQGITFE